MKIFPKSLFLKATPATFCVVAFVALGASAQEATPKNEIAEPAPILKTETPSNVAVAESDGVWTNLLGMEFRRIPAGKFKMGSPTSEDGRERWGSDETQREVTISRDFYMAVFETTQGEWTTAMKNNPSVLKCERLPVTNVSFVDALAFVEKLNEKLREELEAKFGEGARYDLPTEAQWEYACRAGSETAYSFGDACDGSQANVNGCRPYGTTEPGVDLERPTDVGTYLPNAWGLYDMHGNVWEWTLDRYAPYDTNDTTDPANLLGRGLYRVLRGGGWGYDAWSARAANRVNDSDLVFAHRADAVGLRLIIVLGDDEPLLKETVPGNNAFTRRLRERLEKFGDNQ
ncbi:MAG: formylglycine-generating enzyme family protein [Thermoguttaceae bacterium]|nr:formylglycine-generating enzyme family protein [Thermoguttaceae bacterium]